MSILNQLFVDKKARRKAEFIMQVVRTVTSILAATVLIIHYVK